MFLKDFFQEESGCFVISPEQASQFAKTVANDFNPIHDPQAKRFCVPGDLLFALVVMTQGLYQQMDFRFQGMVGRDTTLMFARRGDHEIHLVDAGDSAKTYLSVSFNGDVCTEPADLEAFIRSYVSFSGHNFIHILEPLMTKHQVMVNPARPLIIYESMSFSLDSFRFFNPSPRLAEAALKTEGKRGDVNLSFDILDQGKSLGSGNKALILSGLRPFETEGMEAMTRSYNKSREKFLTPLVC